LRVYVGPPVEICYLVAYRHCRKLFLKQSWLQFHFDVKAAFTSKRNWSQLCSPL